MHCWSESGNAYRNDIALQDGRRARGGLGGSGRGESGGSKCRGVGKSLLLIVSLESLRNLRFEGEHCTYRSGRGQRERGGLGLGGGHRWRGDRQTRACCSQI